MINDKSKKKMHLKFIELYIIIFYGIIILNEIKISKEYNLKLLNLKNEIFITINGSGTQKILSDNYESNLPSEIIVNNNNIDEINNYIDNLEDKINNITMKWNEPLSNCSSMFRHLKNIISIDLSNFDSSKVLSMKNMFNGCSSLKSLDLSKLDTSSLKDMNSMFSGCNLLESLDLSNLNTSSVTNVYKMFSGCKSLKSLDLSKLNMSSVTDMRGLFYGCNLLESLDLSKLDTSSAVEMNNMFYGCNLLESLDLSNLNTSSVKNMDYMFSGCSSLISLDLSKLDTSSVTDMKGIFSGCSALISLDLSKLNTSSVVDMGYMFSSCSSLIALDLNKLDTSSVVDMGHMFSDCSSLISLDLSNFVDNINLTYNDMFLNCNQSLLYCINETKMSNKFLSFINEKLENKNCSDICFSENKKVILEKKICILNYSDDDIKQYESNTIYYENCSNGTDISSINNYTYIENYDDIYSFYHLFENNEISIDNTLDNFRYDLRNKKLDTLIDNIIIKDKKSISYKNNNIIYELSSTDIDNNDYNISNINLRECENKLKLNNDININDSLLIFKVDIYGVDILIPLIEYEIYNIKTKEKLNLSICKNDKIDISISVNLNENYLYKYNISDEYYNNICCVKDRDIDIDIILNDRRNDYYTNNLFVCEKDCFFKEYNYNTKEVICECLIKIKFPLISEIYIDKNLFIKDIKNISNIMNLGIIKCYDILFSKEGLIKNIGSYILLSIILADMVLLLLFIIKGFKEIKNHIEYIKIKNKNIHKNIHKNKNLEKKINKKKNKKHKKHRKNTNNPPKTKRKKKNSNKNTSNLESINDNSTLKFKNINLKNNNELSNLKNTHINYNDKELNRLNYSEALIIDKRNYTKYYFSLLKTKHIILFTFFNNNDYNSKIIKIYLFLFSFASFLIINALFFNDLTIHKIYEFKGRYNFINQLPTIFYSSIISLFINIIIKYLSLSENNILKIKYETHNIVKKSRIVLQWLKAKFIAFFILTFLLLISFWYYISCFCAIYRNTQIHLIKDSLSSCALSLLYPFILYLIPGIFRIPSLRAKNKDKKCMYLISKYIQIL